MLDPLQFGTERALSVRQPRAWCLAAGFKPIENRSQCFDFRGKFLIHSSQKVDLHPSLIAAIKLFRKTITAEFPGDSKYLEEKIAEYARAVWADRNRGAFIGSAEVVDCVHESDSMWFTGPHGLVIQNAVLWDEPIPWRGALGFWRVQEKGRIVLSDPDFDTGMAEVATLIPCLSDEGFAQLKTDALKISTELGIPTGPVVRRLYELFSMAVPLGDVFEKLRQESVRP